MINQLCNTTLRFWVMNISWLFSVLPQAPPHPIWQGVCWELKGHAHSEPMFPVLNLRLLWSCSSKLASGVFPHLFPSSVFSWRDCTAGMHTLSCKVSYTMTMKMKMGLYPQTGVSTADPVHVKGGPIAIACVITLNQEAHSPCVYFEHQSITYFIRP